MPILVKIDQESARRRTDTQTDRQTDTQTQTDFIICPMLYAIAMGQIITQVEYYHQHHHRRRRRHHHHHHRRHH